MKTLFREVKTETQEEIVYDACEFAEKEIRPFAGEFERNESIPHELIAKMAERKYLAAPFPEEFGGLGLDPLHYGYLTEAIGKGCPSTRALLTVHTSLVGETLMKWGKEEQKTKWLPVLASGRKIAAFALSEPDIGSDAQSVKTSYRETETKFILNGRKKWITYGNIADIFLVIASDDGRITSFIVERDFNGVKTSPIKTFLIRFLN